MKFSTSELSYLRDSLTSKPPIRPDSRSVTQFRPLESTVGCLSSANGSSRVRTADGAECIVGVKAKVVREPDVSELINVDIDISGLRDDASLTHVLGRLFQSMLATDSILKALKLSYKYSYKLFIDATVISQTSHPLSMLSFAIYLALMTTKLPLLVSAVDDEAAEEIPMFHDDWAEAVPLCPPTSDWRPPILFLGAIVGQNILIDPVQTEETVSEIGIIMGFTNGKVTAPIRTINLSGPSQAVKKHGITKSILTEMYNMVTECGPDVVEALDDLITSSSTGVNKLFV